MLCRRFFLVLLVIASLASSVHASSELGPSIVVKFELKQGSEVTKSRIRKLTLSRLAKIKGLHILLGQAQSYPELKERVLELRLRMVMDERGILDFTLVDSNSGKNLKRVSKKGIYKKEFIKFADSALSLVLEPLIDKGNKIPL